MVHLRSRVVRHRMSLSRAFHRLVVCACLVVPFAGPALAQSTTPAGGSQSGDWKFSVYPILAWVPTTIDLDLSVPIEGGDGSIERGRIVDSRFDGAFLGGFSATNGTWRVDADLVWAAVGGDRPDSPRLSVDVDLIYGHANIGRRIYKELFVTTGVRRLALKYDIEVNDLDNFSRKPGLWDPLVGVAWHHVGDRLEVHGLLEGGGFGVGSEREFAASLRMDWKPFRHFGLTAGYNYLTLEFEDEVTSRRTFEATQTLGGPVVGIGFYF